MIIGGSFRAVVSVGSNGGGSTIPSCQWRMSTAFYRTERALFLRQASEQYFTSSQFLAQARRHVMGRPQTAHNLLGSDSLLPLNSFFMNSPSLYRQSIICPDLLRVVTDNRIIFVAQLTGRTVPNSAGRR